MDGPIRRSQLSSRPAKAQDSMEQAIARFQDRLGALERECQIFRTFGGWKDESHRARARELIRQLNVLERTLNADTSQRQQLGFQRQNLLLRYQTFKRTYRQFWEDLTG